MSRALLPLLLCLCVLSHVQGQPAEPTRLPALLLPTYPHFDTHLRFVEAHIAQKNWPAAVTLLQKMIDQGENVYVPTTRITPHGKRVTAYVTLRSEANRLVSELPYAGLNQYENQYVEASRKLMKDAPKHAELRAFNEVVERYFYTWPGRRAAEKLASEWLKRGQTAKAADLYERLLDRGETNRLFPITLYEAAQAFHATEDHRNFARVWNVLVRQLDKEGLNVDGKVRPLKELRAELEQKKRQPKEQIDWAMFRGNDSRSAVASGVLPGEVPVWEDKSEMELKTPALIDDARARLEKAKLPLLPSFHPLAVTVEDEGGKFPLVVSRGFWGISARHLNSTNRVDPDSKQLAWKIGGLEWEARSVWSLEQMLWDSQYVSVVKRTLEEYLNPLNRPGVMFENSLTGTVSCDKTRVYVIEDFGIPPPPPNPGVGRVGATGRLGEAHRHNRLQAIEAAVGKLKWEAGTVDERRKDDLSFESFFLGAPLPLNDKLFVLNEKNGDLRLLTLEPSTGEVQSAKTLGKVRDTFYETINRRLDAAHISHSEGILICQPNSGGVLAVDADTFHTRWVHLYDTPLPVDRVKRWRASAPIIQGNKVLIAPPDADQLTCLRLRDGNVLWKVDRQEDDLYVGGVTEEMVIIVGAKECRGLRLTDGKEQWKLQPGTPSGLGVMAGGRYYLPLAGAARTNLPGICVIDPSKGQIVSHIRTHNKRVPGNLCFHSDCLISLSATHITAYPILGKQPK